MEDEVRYVGLGCGAYAVSAGLHNGMSAIFIEPTFPGTIGDELIKVGSVVPGSTVLTFISGGSIDVVIEALQKLKENRWPSPTFSASDT